MTEIDEAAIITVCVKPRPITIGPCVGFRAAVGVGTGVTVKSIDCSLLSENGWKVTGFHWLSTFTVQDAEISKL